MGGKWPYNCWVLPPEFMHRNKKYKDIKVQLFLCNVQGMIKKYEDRSFEFKKIIKLKKPNKTIKFKSVQ